MLNQLEMLHFHYQIKLSIQYPHSAHCQGQLQIPVWEQNWGLIQKGRMQFQKEEPHATVSISGYFPFDCTD